VKLERSKSEHRFLKVPRNCWRLETAQRVGFVIDAANYFQALHEAFSTAERQILILGWDTDSRVGLGDPRRNDLLPFNEYLYALCERKPQLQVYILSWDFTFIYSFEREFLPNVKFDWFGHERVRFEFDNVHPALGSHHQKVVVIDDRLAFSGGLDICARRWDTPEHLANDPRRIDPWGKSYGPFHDVQVLVDGSAARALGDLARDRWRRATGEVLPSVADEFDLQQAQPQAWPSKIPIDAKNVKIGISRTVPAYQTPFQDLPREIKPVHEIERLFIDSIARARQFIFFEAQYFSSRMIARALQHRLQEPEGPEIVMIVPRDATGFIEESTMTVLRHRMLKILEKADVDQGRFRVYHPVVPNLEKGYVKVHSKVCVIDDEFCRIGSANLNQRSMGLDTECDLSFESLGQDDLKQSIASLRARLLAEHLGVSEHEFELRFQDHRRRGLRAPLIATIESFRGGDRSLVPLNRKVPPWVEVLSPTPEVIDPGGPYRISGAGRRYFQNISSVFSRSTPWIGRFKVLSFLGILIMLSLLWQFTPLREWVNPARLAQFMNEFGSQTWAPWIVLLAFLFGGFVLVPQTALVVATALTFDALTALVLAQTGTLLSAAATYYVGFAFQSEALERISNRWLRKIQDKLAVGGWLAVMVVRLMPVAPFSVINLVSGSIRIPFHHYMGGTFAGTLPGIVLAVVVTDRITTAVRSQEFRALFVSALVLLAGWAFVKLVQWLRKSRFRSSHAAAFLMFYFAAGGLAALEESTIRFELCPHIIIETQDRDIEWTEGERRLACGDETQDRLGRPWSEIPLNQAEYFLRNFLQGKGFHHPVFTVRGTQLHVRTGSRLKPTRIEWRSWPEGATPNRYRSIGDPTLTPEFLDGVESWTDYQLKRDAYACSVVTSKADIETGEVFVEIDAREKQRIVEIIDNPDLNIDAGVLDRQNAFRVGDEFDEMLVQLTRQRLHREGLVQAVSLPARCEDDGVRIRRDVVLGTTRELRVGVGGNTDEGLRSRVRVRQIRIGRRASQAQAQVDASFRRQEAQLSGNWFYDRHQLRNSLEPRASFERLDERRVASRSWIFGVSHVWNREFTRGQGELRAGPFWQNVILEEGIGPADSTLVAIEGSLAWRSHNAEFFEQSPRRGSQWRLSVLNTQKNWGANFTASRVQLRGQVLFNTWRYDPPWMILGVRYSLGSTLTERGLQAEQLPVRFRFFAGASEDLRGFERQSLPSVDQGGLTEALVGVELRFYKALFSRLDPFVFVDVGQMGVRSLRLDPITYLSPGLGLRWESPVGTFRGFIAQGLIQNPPDDFTGKVSRLRGGLSYGEEF